MYMKPPGWTTVPIVISTEEERIVNLKIIDKIDHQAIQYSIKAKGNIASEKNLNFSLENFDVMWTELYYQTFEKLIVRNNADLGFENL